MYKAMNKPVKSFIGGVLFLLLGVVQTSSVMAKSDDFMQREIAAKIAESTLLRGTRIEVHVEQRLVVLSGVVRLLEQKLVSERISWTTLGVFEVDNEIRVVPKLPLTDVAIERKVREIIKTYQRFHGAGLMVSVDEGVVSIQGNFSGIADPSFLKHKAAAVEGVLDIKIHAAFLAQLNDTE